MSNDLNLNVLLGPPLIRRLRRHLLPTGEGFHFFVGLFFFSWLSISCRS